MAITAPINAPVLVELHRLLDYLTTSSSTMAEMVGENDRESIEDCWWYNYGCWKDVQKLVVRLLEHRAGFQWIELGSAIGECVVDITIDDFFPGNFGRLSALANLCPVPEVKKKLDAVIAFGEALRDKFDDDPYRLGPKLTAKLGDLDNEILTLLRGGLAPDPLVVIDEPHEELMFLGRRFCFKDFQAANATGGLRCYLVLASRPQAWITRSELLRIAGLAADEETLTGYISRFRNVLKPAIEECMPKVNPDQQRLIGRAFIETRRGNQDNTVKAAYRLRAGPRQIQFLRRESIP